ncbi:hypothetical protein L6164_007435 [Bauhinia variegata]|uniref:Uncharacterized protein n=1 Tax=Bauhinia variegata TaxID=167791 RepID=A0ACB9PGC4_BAUVA|nr:hypothetical protein L6164_007435 [Bauhinia variegata]
MVKKTFAGPMYLAGFIIFFVIILYTYTGEWLSWSRKAAEEAEAVAAIRCSGHGRAYLDGLVLSGNEDHPVCECNSCYGGLDCSQFLSDCAADANSGDPYFLEPFWMSHAESSAILVAGWHRMGYRYSDGSYISELLVKHIHKLHDMVGNAVTDGSYIVFGAGSAQLLNAAVYALSLSPSSAPAKVVTTTPYYAMYKMQTQLFNSLDYRFEGDTSLWKNNLDNSTRFIEFVTSPNNPDGMLNKAVLDGPNVKAIYDHAYYWPHFTAIPAPADEDLMLFTISKLTGHAGTRFGWAVIKDEAVYQRMIAYTTLNTMGVSRDAQLRVLKLLNFVLEEEEGRELFQFGYKTMTDRWIKLKEILSLSKRFSLQQIAPQYCSFFQKIREPSPAYAWLKCEREEDKDCYRILRAANIIGREGSMFSAEDRYVRLSLIKSQDDFEILADRLMKLVAEEQGHELLQTSSSS